MSEAPSPSTTPKKPLHLWIVVLVVAAIAVAVVVFAVSKGQTGQETNTPIGNVNVAVNTNGASNVNSVGNANATSNLNASSVPQGWQTYDSSTSTMQIFRQLDPPFIISYPGGWQRSEELGGLFLTESSWTGAEPNISIGRLQQTLTGDLIEACKGSNNSTSGNSSSPIYDTARLISVDGVQSAYLAFRLPSSVQPNDKRSDSIQVCIPLRTGTAFIVAQPRDSSLVTTYFDSILSTYRTK